MSGGARRIALVSRYPVTRWQTTTLPGAPVRSPVWTGDGLLMSSRGLRERAGTEVECDAVRAVGCP
jgi:hypothetical protein